MYRSLPLQSWGPLPCFASPPWWTVSLELKTGIYCFSLHFLSRFCHCDLKKQKQKRIYIEECLVLSKFTSLRWVAFIAVMGCMQPVDQRFYVQRRSPLASFSRVTFSLQLTRTKLGVQTFPRRLAVAVSGDKERQARSLTWGVTKCSGSL